MKNSILFLFLTFMAASVLAMGSPVPPPQRMGYLIDDFEDGEYNLNQKWWVFGKIEPEVIATADLKEGNQMVYKDVGSFSLYIKGETETEWYSGGMGCYIAKAGQEISKYRNLQLDIYGYGPGQGTLKIELFDDDNNNWFLELNTLEAYTPLFDDRFVNEFMVDWVGWKRVVIPLYCFVDSNPSIGNDIWDPDQKDQSGGLLQMQFICIASHKIGAMQYAVDNIKLTR